MTQKPSQIFSRAKNQENAPHSSLSSLKSPEKGLKLYSSCRWKIAFACCGCILTLFAQRTCISMAIVCMEHSALRYTSQESNNTVDINMTSITERAVPTTVPKEWIGVVLSAYFYGYIITPLVGGLVAQKFGPKFVILGSMIIVTFSNLLTPLCLRNGIYLVIAMRILMGLSSGMVIPSMSVMWANWAPMNEKATLLAVSYSGMHLGNIMAMGIAGFICEIPLDEGWPFAFYSFGIGAVIWMIFWCFFVYDTPNKHPRITQQERNYIEHGKSSFPHNTITGVPWRKILTSMPFWSIILGHCCYSWLMILQTTFLPIYMNDVLKFEVRDNGLLSSIPFIFMLVMGLAFAVAADYIIAKKIWSITLTRNVFQISGMVLPAAILFGLSYIGSELRNLAVGLIALQFGLQASTLSSFRVNHLDIAPSYAGPLIGLSVTCACAVAIFVPLLTAALTSEGTLEQWKTVFIIAGVINIIGAIFFGIFSSGNEQKWAQDRVMEIDIDCPVKNEESINISDITSIKLTNYENKAFNENE